MVLVSYLAHYDTLLENATDVIKKCDSYFITKCDKSLLQNALSCLLQTATVLLQIVAVVTNCGVNYKMRRYMEQPGFIY